MLRQYQNPVIVGSSMLKWFFYKSNLENSLIWINVDKNEVSDECNFHSLIFFTSFIIVSRK